MRRVIMFAILLLLAFSNARANDIHGVWTARSESSDTINVTFAVDQNTHGQTMPLSSFHGLTEAQIGAVSETPVHFGLDREAGTLTMEGTFKLRDGVGHFTFTPKDSYFASLRALGVSLDDLEIEGGKTAETLFHFAVLDVSTAYIHSLQAEGYRESARKYMEMRIFRVTPELVHEYRDLGYRDVPAQTLIEMQIHRVTPQFIRELASNGYRDVAVSQLVAFRIHRVTPEAIRDYRSLGYDHLTPDQLVAMSIHGATPDFVRELKTAGYENVPVDKLISMKIHGIDAEYVKRMQGAR